MAPTVAMAAFVTPSSGRGHPSGVSLQGISTGPKFVATVVFRVYSVAATAISSSGTFATSATASTTRPRSGIDIRFGLSLAPVDALPVRSVVVTCPSDIILSLVSKSINSSALKPTLLGSPASSTSTVTNTSKSINNEVVANRRE